MLAPQSISWWVSAVYLMISTDRFECRPRLATTDTTTLRSNSSGYHPLHFRRRRSHLGQGGRRTLFSLQHHRRWLDQPMSPPNLKSPPQQPKNKFLNPNLNPSDVSNLSSSSSSSDSKALSEAERLWVQFISAVSDQDDLLSTQSEPFPDQDDCLDQAEFVSGDDDSLINGVSLGDNQSSTGQHSDDENKGSLQTNKKNNKAPGDQNQNHHQTQINGDVRTTIDPAQPDHEADHKPDERAKKDEAARKADEQAKKDEAAHKADEQAKKDEAARKADEQAKKDEAARQADEQAKKDEAARKADEQAKKDEAARKADEQAKKDEAARKADEQAKKDEAAHKADGAKSPGSGSVDGNSESGSYTTAPSSQYSGDATFYATGLGSCGLTDDDSKYIVAVSQHLYDSFPAQEGNPNTNTICGKRIRATYNGASVEVVVHDTCVACAVHDLDFSPVAFEKLAPQSQGRLHGMNWKFVS